MKPSDIPTSISQYISHHYPEHSKISYYMDTENDSSYYAADFKFQKRSYSLLFTLEGNWFETEILLPFEKLPAQVSKSIEDKLRTDFSTSRILKTQEVDVQGMLLYELEIEGKKNNEMVFNEYFFDRKGVFIKMEAIELKAIPSFF
ncbi:MAG: PepSY-like domain-containing protein [Cytophagales bacterium]|nr:PepSY-like domain-containing protein [Cytophaga sp.]